MKRPQYVFRPNLSDPQHRRAWALLQQMSSARRKEFLVQAINQKYTQFHKTPIGDNPAFTFRTFLLRLGLIGPEYKNVRMHLLKNLPGDKAWRHDKSLYPSNQPRPRTDEAR